MVYNPTIFRCKMVDDITCKIFDGFRNHVLYFDSGSLFVGSRSGWKYNAAEDIPPGEHNLWRCVEILCCCLTVYSITGMISDLSKVDVGVWNPGRLRAYVTEICGEER